MRGDTSTGRFLVCSTMRSARSSTSGRPGSIGVASDPALAPMYAQALVGMVSVTAQW